MNYIVIILSLLLVFLCFIRRNSNLLFYLMFIWMWILFAFNYSNADYPMYYGFYNGTVVGQDIEIGFKLLCHFFSNIGFSYTMFMALYSCVGLCLIGKTINEFSKQKSLAAALYFIFPFVFDIIQIRNFLAFALVIYAIKYIINYNKKNLIKYILLILIASTIHKFAFLALIFPLLLKFNIDLKKVLLFVIPMVIFTKSSLFLKILSMILTETKVNAYFLSGTFIPGFKTLVATFLITIMCIFICYMVKKMNIDNNKLKYNGIVELSYKIFLFSLLLFPFYQFNTVMTRFPRSLLPLIYIILSNIPILEKKNVLAVKKCLLLSYICLFIVIVLWYYFFIFDINNVDKTIAAIVNNNYLLDFFKI